MKALINSLKRTHGFKALVAFLTCLLFLIFPSCQKDEFDQDSTIGIYALSSSASSLKKKTTGKVKDVDGNWYKTVKIGTQWWMAENLKTTKYCNRDLIGTTDPTIKAIASESTPKYQWAYEGNESNVATFGRLYTWFTVTDSRGVCPTGWHVSTYDDWTTLIDYLGIWNEIAGKLKESGNMHWFPPDISTNETGFTALPGGMRYDFIWEGVSYVSFDGNDNNGMGTNGCWWCSTEYNVTLAYYKNMTYGDDYVDGGPYNKEMGFSVRCVKDN
jgi:uncharacterized protein (TIGR02145 family)